MVFHLNSWYCLSMGLFFTFLVEANRIIRLMCLWPIHFSFLLFGANNETDRTVVGGLTRYVSYGKPTWLKGLSPAYMTKSVKIF